MTIPSIFGDTDAAFDRARLGCTCLPMGLNSFTYCYDFRLGSMGVDGAGSATMDEWAMLTNTQPIGGSSDSVQPEVSSVVTAHNEEAVISDCIWSISALDGGAPYEIIVVDHGSTDHAASLVMEMAAYRPQIISARHQKNRGRSVARCTGIDAVRAELVGMVDPDIVLPKDWLQRCREAISENGADAVGGIAVPEGDVTYTCNRFALTLKVASMTVSVGGGNGLYRRRVFNLVGVDPSLVEGEDVALNQAMAAAGLRRQTIRDLIVEHRESGDFRSSLDWLCQSGKGATRQLARYRQIRMLDIALAGLMATIAASLMAPRRGVDGRTAWAVPCVYLIAVSSAHMIRKFKFRDSEGRFVLATAAYSVFVDGSFAGRIAGIPGLLRKRIDTGDAE